MNGNKSILPIISLIISLAVLILVLYSLVITSNNTQTSENYAIEKQLAGELADQNLYKASIEEYKRILADPKIDRETRANINYLIGKTSFENLKDYKNAAACYVRARSLNPNGSFYNEAGKNLISCLERMGRMLDAKRELDKTLNIDSIYSANEGETVVAKMGNKPIFLSDIESDIQNLPTEMQKEFTTKEKKLVALNNYIGIELIYRAAVREGLDKDPEIEKLTDRLIKQAVVDRYISNKLLSEISADESDIKNYFLANKEDRYKGKSFEEIKDQVYLEYRREKRQQVFQEYIAKLAAVEKVQIFEEKIK